MEGGKYKDARLWIAETLEKLKTGEIHVCIKKKIAEFRRINK